MRASLLVFFLLIPPALAQRNSAKLSFTDREVTVEYGVARLGKHTIAELPVGQEWRMGMNEASVLRTQLPLVAGDVVVAPGSYRAKLVRKSEKEIVLRLDGGAQALGAKGDLDLPGELVDAKPSELLAIEWNPAPVKGKKDAEFATKLLVHFGPQQVSVPIKVIGARPAKLAGALVSGRFMDSYVV